MHKTLTKDFIKILHYNTCYTHARAHTHTYTQMYMHIATYAHTHRYADIYILKVHTYIHKYFINWDLAILTTTQYHRYRAHCDL